MTSLLYAGDSIIKTHSHQQTLISILTEHNSLYGLSVKVLNTDEFPGGKQYHHEKDYMLKWMQGEVEPIMYARVGEASARTMPFSPKMRAQVPHVLDGQQGRQDPVHAADGGVVPGGEVRGGRGAIRRLGPAGVLQRGAHGQVPLQGQAKHRQVRLESE
jgi:hypothetical protein